MAQSIGTRARPGVAKWVMALAMAGLAGLAAPACAATATGSFQVRALVVAACAVPAAPLRPIALGTMPCLPAPTLSSILPPAPRLLLQQDAHGAPVLVMEF